MVKSSKKQENEGKRFLGVDLGAKRVGLALTDETRSISYPFKTIHRKDLYEEIENIVSEYSIKGIVLGYPLNMDGSAGDQAEESNRVAKEIKAKIGISVYLVDERWTSVEAKKILHPLKKKTSKNKKRIDEIAATIILETFLERQKH